MINIDADEVSRLLPLSSLVTTLADAFTREVKVPLRQTLRLPDEAAQVGTSLLMPAWEGSGYYGVKIINIFPGNRLRGLPGLHSIYILFDGSTGVPLAILDGDAITSRRTAAASALGVKLLANPDASRLLVVGAGRVGRLLGPTIANVRHLESVEVWNINPQTAQACAAQWQAQGLPLRVQRMIWKWPSVGRHRQLRDACDRAPDQGRMVERWRSPRSCRQLYFRDDRSSSGLLRKLRGLGGYARSCPEVWRCTECHSRRPSFRRSDSGRSCTTLPR